MLWRSCRTPREAEASGFGRTHLTGEPAAGGRHDRTLLARVGHRRELFKPLRRFGRTELLGTLVPQAGLGNLAYVLREAELLEHVRIERAGERQRGAADSGCVGQSWSRRVWMTQPNRFTVNPLHHTLGLNT
jgi:hypothetical protein